MSVSLENRLNRLAPERRKQIIEEADRQHAEYLTLQELRKARELTQVQLAEMLGIRQASIARMEKRSDLMISTLRTYVEAMGGKLNIIVEFPGHTRISVSGLGDSEDS